MGGQRPLAHSMNARLECGHRVLLYAAAVLHVMRGRHALQVAVAAEGCPIAPRTAAGAPRQWMITTPQQRACPLALPDRITWPRRSRG